MSDTSHSSHSHRLQCIYFDDLVGAMRQCHENFVLIQNSLTALNRQLSLRRTKPEAVRLIKTEQGLIRESALQLEKEMREVLNAVEEHFATEVRTPGARSQERLWTLTEEMMSQPGRSGSALLASLAAVVAEERCSLENYAQAYCLEDDLIAFQQHSESSCDARELQRLVSDTQRSHVRRVLRTHCRERDSAALAGQLDRLTEDYLDRLEERHQAQNSSRTRQDLNTPQREAARGRREDWSHTLEERLEVIALEAEARCLEDLRKKFQLESETAIASQETANASRAAVEEARALVHTNQETVRRLSRHNRSARRRLEEARADSQPLAAACLSSVAAAPAQMASCSAALDAALPTASPAVSPDARKRPAAAPKAAQKTSLSADASIARMARLVVTEHGRSSVGGADYSRLLSALRSRCQKMDALLATDKAESAAALTHKAPLVQMNREAMQKAAENVLALEEIAREREQLPKVLGLN